MRFVYNDGGRAAAGRRGQGGDCAARAVAIAAQIDYKEACALIDECAQRERRGKRKRGISSAVSGVYRPTMHRVMERLGFTFTATMGIGTGCRVHMREDELPKGRIIVSLSGHYAAVIDGVLHDNHDCTRNGTRCVYGYWERS